MGLNKSKQLDCIFCFISYWNFKCLPLGFVCLFVLPLGFCTFDLLWTPLVVARFRLKILVLFLFLPAQGDIAFAQISSTLQNPELRRLASSLPARALQSKAPRTIDQYSRSFQKFRVWASCFPEITALPTRPLDVALYLEHLIRGDTSSSVLQSASCGISWANKLYGFPDPCQDPLVKNILEAGIRISAKPVVKRSQLLLR